MTPGIAWRKMARRFAALYVAGTPEFRGNWQAISEWLKLSPTPPLNDPVIVEEIVSAGGKPPRFIPPVTSPEHEAKDPDPDYEIIDADELIADAERAAGQPDRWLAMADRLRHIMEQVAATGGYLDKEREFVKATAAQVAALKVIFDRAEGRVAEKMSEREAPIGIVQLPAEGFVCPRCGFGGKTND